jgi:large repetitive protein
VAWSAPDNRGSSITNYKVYWDEGLGGLPRTLMSTKANNVFTASTVSAITAGQSYQFAVLAVNSIGNSAYSNSVTIIAASVPAQPATPTVVSSSRSSIQIQWTAPSSGGSPITKFNVYEADGVSPSTESYAFVSDTGLVQSYTKSIGLIAG